jgi:YHS domain-containing protein
MVGIIRIIVLIVLLYLAYRLVKSIIRFIQANKKDVPEIDGRGEDLVEDPFCHTYIPISQALKVTRKEEVLYFCSKECSKKYFARENN